LKLPLSSAQNPAGSTYSKHCISGWAEDLQHSFANCHSSVCLDKGMQFDSVQNVHYTSYVFGPAEVLETPSAGILANTSTGLLPGRRLGGDDPPPRGPSPRSLPGEHASLVKPRILVVDDERVIADTIAEILNDSGFEATPAYSGDTAIKVIQANCPDVVLTDVVMPGINGVEVAKFVAATCSETKVLLFSGQAAVSEFLLQVNQLGYSFEVLAKPLHPDELIEKLRGLKRTTE
jgi:CheY-like chemotaxis protein